MSLHITVTDVLKWGLNRGSVVIHVTNTSDTIAQDWSVEIYVPDCRLYSIMDNMILEMKSDIQPARYLLSCKPCNRDLAPGQSVSSRFQFIGDVFTWYQP